MSSGVTVGSVKYHQNTFTDFKFFLLLQKSSSRIVLPSYNGCPDKTDEFLLSANKNHSHILALVTNTYHVYLCFSFVGLNASKGIYL